MDFLSPPVLAGRRYPVERKHLARVPFNGTRSDYAIPCNSAVRLAYGDM